MKSTFSIIASLLFLALIAPPAQAENDGFYLDINASSVDLDFRNAGIQAGPSGNVDLEFDRSTTLGVAGGYNLGRWAFELEYWQSNGEYDVTLSNPSGTAREGFDYEEFRASSVFRTSGKWYFLGKLGMSFPDLDVRSPAIHLDMGDAFFYGIGGGVRFNDNLSLELEVTETQDDTTAVNVGVRYHF